MTDHLAVANEILRQLGGRMFTRMTGASALISRPNQRGALSFKLPSTPHFVKDGINHVTVTLTAMDDYTLTFRRVWGSKVTEISEHKGVHCDNLREGFTEFTGLDISLGRPR